MSQAESMQLLGTSHFRVLIGRREFGFSEVGPLRSETDAGLASEKPQHRFAPVVLRRALTRSSELYAWRTKIASGRDDRRTVLIHQLDEAGTIVNSWRLEGAWPCRWSGPSFNAGGTDVAIEELELAYEELVWLTGTDAPPAKPTRSRTKTEGA